MSTNIPPPHFFKPRGSPSQAVNEGSTVKSLQQPPARCTSRFYEVGSEPYSLCREILSKRQRKILAFAFLELENCTWRLTPSALFFPGKSRVEITLLSDAAACGEGWRHSTDGLWGGGGARAELYAISALVSFACIIHVTPTNYLGLAPSKRRNVVDLSEGIFSLLHHAAQSRLHIEEVSSPFSDPVKLRLLIFS